MHHFWSKSLAELAVEISAGKLSAMDLCEIAQAHHQQSELSNGAYIAWDPDSSVKQAKAADTYVNAGGDLSPLHGIPISVKDLYGLSGFATYAGTPKRLPTKWETEGPIVRELKDQSCVIMGKTHSVEFAFGGLGVNPHWESPRNPWSGSQPRVPGGSSSGAGVSLSTGSALVAFGTDTAGSVRIPASMTANVGLKTSKGRWSTAGIVPLSPSLDTVGLLTRTVADAAYTFSAIESNNGLSDPELNSKTINLNQLCLGLCDGLLWEDCSDGVAETVSGALNELNQRGVKTRSIAIAEFDQIYPLFQRGGLAAPELYSFLRRELPQWTDTLDQKIVQRMEDAAELRASEYIDRVELIRRLSAQVAAKLQEVDVLVSPTVPITPPTFEEIEDIKCYRRANLLSLRNTSMANYLGLCAISIPVGLDKQAMPVGLQLMAPHGQDRRLLEVALALERALGTARDRIGLAFGKTRVIV